MPTATMTVKGQTVIPKPIRDHMGLKPWDKLDFTIQGNRDVLIRPSVHDVRDGATTTLTFDKSLRSDSRFEVLVA